LTFSSEARRVAGDRAIIDNQRGMIVMNTAAKSGGVAVDDSQAGNGHGFTRRDVKHGTLCVAIHRKVLSSWS